MKKVTRTIETHTVKVAKVKFENGELKTTALDPITITNEGVDEKKALKLAQKKYGKANQYVIIGIDTTATTYGLDFDKFMELAEIVEK